MAPIDPQQREALQRLADAQDRQAERRRRGQLSMGPGGRLFLLAFQVTAAGAIVTLGMAALAVVTAEASIPLCRRQVQLACQVLAQPSLALWHGRIQAPAFQQLVKQVAADSITARPAPAPQPQAAQQPQPASSRPPLSEQQIRDALVINQEERARCLMQLEASLRDPSSLRLRNDIEQQLQLGMIEYTAANGFGGQSREVINCHTGEVTQR
jgi:hypothetical protein